MNRLSIIDTQRTVVLFIQDTIHAFRQKGPKQFYRAMTLSGISVGIAYFISGMPAGQVATLDKELTAAKSVSQYVVRYKDAKEQLDRFAAHLPDPRNQDVWLQNEVRESMKQEEIELTSISPASRNDYSGYNVLGVTANCRTTYKKLGQWIARLESGKIPLSIASLTLSKDGSDLGMNSIVITINVVLPKEAGSAS